MDVSACRTRFCVYLGILVFCAGVIRGNAQTEPSSITPVFRASTHLVVLDVVVTDKAGKPIPELRKEDFSVKESGKAQAISFLNQPKTETAATVPALPRNTYSNAAEYRLAGATPTVIVLDAANTSFADQVYARRQMLQYLQKQYQPGQRTAIFTLTDKLVLLKDFTGDPELLIESLKKFAPGEPGFTKNMAPELPPSIIGVSTAQQYFQVLGAFEHFQRSQIEYTIDRRASVTLEALRRINRILGGLPGRKNVIWVTDGFPFALDPDLSVSPSTDVAEMFHQPGRYLNRTPRVGVGVDHKFLFVDQIREISAQLATSQIAIYPVDAEGLVVTRSTTANAERQETMRAIAFQTGGKAFISQNDIQSGLALAQQDQAATYTIGYYPENRKFDGKYRAIQVKINHSGAQTNYRHGYFAVDPLSAKKEEVDRSIGQAWEDGVPDTMVTFQTKITAIGNAKARIEFLVDPNTISFADDANGKKLNVSFYVASCANDGKILNLKGANLERAYTLENIREFLRDGMRLKLDVDAPAGTRDLHIAVRDNRTGYIGTLTAALAQP